MEEKEGISFSDIFKTIWSQKLLALIVMLAVLIAGTLALHYGYGASKEEYVSIFSINVSENSEGNLMYPDGTLRNFRDFTSLENLTAVKNSDEAFAKIDVEKMYKKSDISLLQSKNDRGVYIYNLTVKAKYFSSQEVASLFLNEVASTPLREIFKWVGGLSENIASAYESKLGNELKLEYLKSQLSAISERFNSLAGLPTASKEKLSDYNLEASMLTGELHTYYYEPSVEALKSYQHLITERENELERTNKVLDDLKQGSTVTQDVAYLIERYSLQAANLEQQIESYYRYLEKAGCANNGGSGWVITEIPDVITESAESKAFTQKLNALLAKVQSLTSVDECGYYETTPLISYEGAQVQKEGDMGLVMSAVISLVAGLIIAMLVAYIVGRTKANKEATQGEPAASEHAEVTEPASPQDGADKK